MARGRSVLSAKKPAVATADKAVAQWKEMRRIHGDDRVGADLGLIQADTMLSGTVPSSGVLTAAFAQSEQADETVVSMQYVETIVDSAERGVLLADVSTWGAIAIWLISWVQAMAATVEDEGVVGQVLNKIYQTLNKKAAEGARLALFRRVFDESAMCHEHSYREHGTDEFVPVLMGECHEQHQPWTLVPYDGPADLVPAIIYAPLMEMGRSAANDPGLDPELAQFKAIQIIANRRWKDARWQAQRDNHEESLEAVLATAGAPLLMRFNKDDRSITSATDCEVRDRDGNVLRVIPAISEVTEVPCAPQEMRTGGLEYMDFHWKGDNRAAEGGALAHVSRIELVRMIVNGVRDGIILTDGRTGRPTKDANVVCSIAAVILDLRGADSLRERYHDEEHSEKYRNLTPNEVAEDLSDMLGQEITRYQVMKALGILEQAEDAYWHFIHQDGGDSYVESCHACNPEHHERREARKEQRIALKSAVDALTA